MQLRRSHGVLPMKLSACVLAVGLLAGAALSVVPVASGEGPAADRRSGEFWPFGIGSCYINNRSVEDNQRWLPQMAKIGLRGYRTPHTDWAALEPEQGRWDWKALDAQIEYLDRHGFQYGCLLVGNPAWNQADPPGFLPVRNLDGWSNYVTRLARHVRGKATHFEVWNEPPNFTGKDQTPADYAQIVVAAHRAAKAVDPAFQIGLAAKSVHVNYLEQVIAAGAKGHYDYIVLHPYEVLDGIADDTGSESLFFHIAATVRRMLAARDPARRDVPIVFTELGVSAGKGEVAQANALAKAYALAIAQGIQSVQWFEGRDGDSGPMGLLDGDGRPRAAYHVLANLIRHLGPRPSYLGWTRIEGRGLALAFEGREGPALVAWGTPDSRGSVDFGAKVKVVELASGAIRETQTQLLDVAPVIVLAAPPALLDSARANRDRPLDWGGDYAQAREVSIEYAQTAIEKGLHTRSGAHVAQAVLAYGGPARAGDVPGGNAFVVDPGFLCYDAVPIEITAEVRRNPANDNAGFKLVYESTDGFKTAGTWYTIPDNKDWHTARWRIDDPQFVAYWGFHFTLESDGAPYNRYLIRRVTVRRLDR